MNEPDPIQNLAEGPDLKQEVAGLRRSATVLLLGVTVLSLTLTAFLVLESHHKGKDLDATREYRLQVTEMIKKQRADIEKFTTAIAIFGQTHLDLAPLLAKYGISGAPAAAPKK